jgi:hypothetical protein
MTQAFNLSQLANKVNTSGQLDVATGVTGTLPTENLPTVPPNKGGTGLTSVGTAGNVLTSNGTTWVSQAAGGSAPLVNAYTSPTTWTKPATLKGIKVTVVGGGGAGGAGATAFTPTGNTSIAGGGGGGGGFSQEWIPAPSIPGPVAVTAGTGTNSFGSFLSATGGSAGGAATPTAAGVPSAGGAGSGGNINANGSFGSQIGQLGGISLMSTGAFGSAAVGNNYGGGGMGRLGPGAGGAGGTGLVLVEEFY